MKKRHITRLQLSAETTRILSDAQIAGIAGGAPPGFSTNSNQQICWLTRGETYCYSICIGGGGCVLE